MDPNGLLVTSPISAVDSASDFYNNNRVERYRKVAGSTPAWGKGDTGTHCVPVSPFVRQGLFKEAVESLYGSTASLAQMVEHLLCKLKVLGSIPKGGNDFLQGPSRFL